MVDINSKPVTERRAVAGGRIRMSAACMAVVAGGTASKGDVLGVARIAGIMAVKRTAELIPLCHPLGLSQVSVDFTLLEEKSIIECVCTVANVGKTGVEMEALTGVSIALLTIYDMCKSIDRGMVIENILLLEKEGGKSGVYRAERGEQAPC